MSKLLSISFWIMCCSTVFSFGQKSQPLEEERGGSVWTASGFLSQFDQVKSKRNKNGQAEIIEIGVIRNDNAGTLLVFDREKKKIVVYSFTEKREKVRVRKVDLEVKDRNDVIKKIQNVVRVFPKNPIDVIEAALNRNGDGGEIWFLRFLDPNGGGIEMVITPSIKQLVAPGLLNQERSVEALSKTFNSLISSLVD
jgi:hypothetical protein